MAVVNRPDYSVGVWASNGDIAAPTSEKIEIGHIVEKPLKEVMNWIQNRQDRGIVYLLQQGISEWVSTETYPENGYVKRSGVIYKALSQNTDRDPLTYTDIWRQAFDTFGSAAEVQLEVDKIKTQEGYLDLYVSKNNPVLNSRAEGVAYSARQGFPNFTTDEYGYVFKNNETSGLFYTTAPIIANNGEAVVKFEKSNDLNDSSLNVATTEWVQNLLRDTVNSLVPIGTILEYTSLVIPSENMMNCHGQAISRTEYAELFARIGTTYGAGDGVTTFNLPDKRGRFSRELDVGKGIDAGRTLGSVQTDAMQNITGEFAATDDNLIANLAKGAFFYTGRDAGTGTGGVGTEPIVGFDASRVVRTASETRPSNIATISLIRVK